MSNIFTIGLTGGIASGKSTVQAAFESWGVPVLDADIVAREVVMPGAPALAQIAEVFGAQMLHADGTLDRAAMRARVFGNPEELKRLEAITHPHIRVRMLEWKAAQRAPYCIISVAILLEAKMTDLVDRVLLIDTSEHAQRARLRQRDGISDVLIEQMLAAQWSRQQRLAQSQDVLCNAGELAAIADGVRQLHGFYLEIEAQGQRDAPGVRHACP